MLKNTSLFKTFKNKKIIVTGHTGFKGTWLTAWLKLMGADVTGISIDIPTTPSHFANTPLSKNINDIRLDIRSKKIEGIINKVKPDFIFHLAAQSLVSKSHENPVTTWETNVMGTANLLQSLVNYKRKCVAIFITSDKCYDNKEWIWGYRETDDLGGSDPYSGSKAAAEILIKNYTKSFFEKNKNIKIASVRAGNVIGGGDWSMDRIIPDVIRSWSQNKPLVIRNAGATRPWQHVLEPLSGYLALAVHMSNKKIFEGQAFNFGPSDRQINTVKNVVAAINNYLPDKKLIIKKGINTNKEHHFLKLNCDKAQETLNWSATLDFDETIKLTMDWYLAYYRDPKNIYKLTLEQIETYMDISQNRRISWSF